MSKQKSLEDLEADLKKVDRPVNRALFLGLGLFVVMNLFREKGYLQFISDNFLVAMLVVFISALVIYTARKKNRIANDYGLRCHGCNRTPKAGIAQAAYADGVCPYCGKEYE
ncbi:MAG TPA: hypothetical protein VFX02_10640 [Gammaproteobacteria bacterium]|nr:hypothetical protein [Gammaproteobacteria bacterium]